METVENSRKWNVNNVDNVDKMVERKENVRNGETMLLQSLYLLPRAQKQGVGRQALQFIRQYCLDNSFSVFRCHCQPDNHNAIGFYKKMGGVIVDRDENNEERWQDSVIFEFSV